MGHARRRVSAAHVSSPLPLRGCSSQARLGLLCCHMSAEYSSSVSRLEERTSCLLSLSRWTRTAKSDANLQAPGQSACPPCPDPDTRAGRTRSRQAPNLQDLPLHPNVLPVAPVRAGRWRAGGDMIGVAALGGRRWNGGLVDSVLGGGLLKRASRAPEEYAPCRVKGKRKEGRQI